jgi:hypothetical protein
LGPHGTFRRMPTSQPPMHISGRGCQMTALVDRMHYRAASIRRRTMLGAWISKRLPQHHLSTESKDAIKLATAVVGTLSALAIGFLVASAKTTFDDAESELKTSAARLVLLDRVLAQYGPEMRDSARTTCLTRQDAHRRHRVGRRNWREPERRTAG